MIISSITALAGAAAGSQSLRNSHDPVIGIIYGIGIIIMFCMMIYAWFTRNKL